MLVFPALFVPNSTVRGASRISPESFHALKFLSRSLLSISVASYSNSVRQVSEQNLPIRSTVACFGPLGFGLQKRAEVNTVGGLLRSAEHPTRRTKRF